MAEPRVPLEALEHVARDLCDALRDALPPDIGFVAVFFRAYGTDTLVLSTVERRHIITTLQDAVASLQAMPPETAL